MDFLGLFNFAFTCFDLLAWPLFALGYPLCASIRAIETNSNNHMRKLVTYWILFSLISLFELAFVKLIEWIPLWPYIKLGTICWLVLPRFNGAHYCYKTFIQPCLSVNIEEVMKRFYKRQKASVENDNFLSVAERYVTENGTDALEKLIANKGSNTGFGVGDIKTVPEAEKWEMPSMVKPNLLHQKGPGTGFSVEETKAVAEEEKKEMPQTVKVLVKGSRTEFGVEKIKAVADIEQKEMLPTVKSKGNEFKADYKDINRMEQPEENAPAPENLVKKKTIAAVEVTEMTTPVATKEALAAKIPTEKVQKEWTCAVCQVKTPSEAHLNIHLAGKKHRSKCEELKSKTTKQTTKVKAGPSNPASKGAQDNQSSKKPASNDGLSQNKIKKQDEKFQAKVKSEAGKQNADNSSNAGSTNLKSWCPHCAVMCMSETDYLSHLNGKKHLARIQEMASYPAGVQGWDYSAFPAQEMAAGVQGWDHSAVQGWDQGWDHSAVQGWDHSAVQGWE